MPVDIELFGKSQAKLDRFGDELTEFFALIDHLKSEVVSLREEVTTLRERLTAAEEKLAKQ